MDETTRLPYFDWMLDFAKEFISIIDIGSDRHRIGAMSYSELPNTMINLEDLNTRQEILENLENEINNVPRMSPPDVSKAFDHVHSNMFTSHAGDRQKAKNFVILITDNPDSFHTEETISAAHKLKDTGVKIYTVGIRMNDTYELDSVSSKPLDEFQYLINGRQELDEVPQQIKQRMKEGMCY